MPTYDFTKGSGAIAEIDCNRFFCVKIKINVADIIASDATLTAAGLITAADVIQLWDVPVPVCLLVALASFRVGTAGTAAGTISVGIAGSTEMFSAISTATAGYAISVADDATWGTDNYGGYPFTTTDTIDITFNTDETVGEFFLYLPGYTLD